MKNTQTDQMNTASQFCPNLACSARGQVGQGTIVSHGKKRPRYRCKVCGKTFSAQAGTMFAGVRKPTELIVIVVTLLAYGCPVQAIVKAYGLDERTVAKWRDRAGAQCEKVHQAIVVQQHLNLMHVQADEIRAKGCKMVAWIAMAVMVSSRLWLGGVVSVSRDRALADQLLKLVRACAGGVAALLICTDGWNAYPNSIRRAFREKVKAVGQRWPHGEVWPQLVIGRLIKHSKAKRVVGITQQIVCGTLSAARRLLSASQGGTVLNTAYIERFNGTLRERLATLTRKCRHAARQLQALHSGMYLIGCTYNFCWPHHELSGRAQDSSGRCRWRDCTPAMASGLTDHVWSVRELLSYKVAPTPWVPPKRRGRPRKAIQGPIPPKWPRGRPRKVVQAPSTS